MFFSFQRIYISKKNWRHVYSLFTKIKISLRKIVSLDRSTFIQSTFLSHSTKRAHMHNPYLQRWFAGALLLFHCPPFTTATYCRLKTQASCIGDICQFTDIGQVRTNPFEHNNNLPFYKSNKKFKVGFADLDNDGDQDLVVGRADVTGIIYFENTATFGMQATFEDRLNNPQLNQPVNGPFSRLTTATHHWAPEKVSQAVFYDMDNDGDLDMVLGGLKGTARYYENVGTVDRGDFMPWDGTSTGASYKSMSGKNWDFDPFQDVVQTDPCILINRACRPDWKFTITSTDFSGAKSKAAGVVVTQASNLASGVLIYSRSSSTETTIQVTATDSRQVFDLAADLIIDGMTIPQSKLVAVTRKRSGSEESSIAVYDIDSDGDGDVVRKYSSFLLKLVSWKHCSFDFYSSSLFQTCFILIASYLFYLKTPKQVFFNVYKYI